MKRTTYQPLILAGLICLVIGSSQTALARKGMPKHVIVIGFDGLSAKSITNGAKMPNLHKLMDEGSYTLQQRSILPSSSACNWASMFMGAGPELHGFTDWGTQTPQVEPRELNHYGNFPGIFGLYRDKAPSAEIGYIYEWGGMRYLADTLAISYCKNATLLQQENSCLNSAIKYIREKKPNLCAIIFDEPDHTGHSRGWESEEYMTKMQQLDSYLGKMVEAIKEAGIMNETVIMVVADHGGKTMNEMQTPLVFYGKGIKKGYRITQNTMVYDVAATIAYMLKVKQPQVWIARPITSIFK